MKKNIIAIIIFIVVLVFPVLSWPVLSRYDTTVINENRSLAAAPGFGDDYFAKLDNYFVDRAPYRKFLIKLYNDCSRGLGKIYEKILNWLGIPFYTSVNDVIFGKDDWLFYLADRSLDYYVANNLPTEEELATMVEKAQKVSDYFKSLGKEFVIFTAPDKEQIYDNMMPSSIVVENEFKRSEVIANYFAAHSDVKVVYPRKSLLQERDNLQLYFKTDTHWNNAGAFYGAKSLLELLNITPQSVLFTEKPAGPGDLAGFATLGNVEDMDYDVIYRPDIKVTVKEGLEPTIENRKNDFHCESTNQNGKKLLLAGDSFRMSMINILAKEFEKSTFAFSPNMYNEVFIQEMQEADVIVFEAVERGEVWLFTNLLNDLINMLNL